LGKPRGPLAKKVNLAVLGKKGLGKPIIYQFPFPRKKFTKKGWLY